MLIRKRIVPVSLNFLILLFLVFPINPLVKITNCSPITDLESITEKNSFSRSTESKYANNDTYEPTLNNKNNIFTNNSELRTCDRY